MANNPGHTQKNKKPSAGEVAATPVFLQSQDVGEVFGGVGRYKGVERWWATKGRNREPAIEQL